MDIQKIAEQLLTEKKVDCIIGYEQGFDDVHPMPCIIFSPDAVQKLIFNNNCFHNLSKYVLKVRGKKIGIFVKGCDLFSLRELIKEHQVNREDLVIIALACDGVQDRQAIKRNEYKLATKCMYCGVKIPKEDVDYVIGSEKIKQTTQGEGIDKELLAKLEELEKLTPTERLEFWKKQFEKCIRCYACREVCPSCYCPECFSECTQPKWINTNVSPMENIMFHLIRTQHVFGRCTDCRACEVACPVGIPLSLITARSLKMAKELFDYVPGADTKTLPPLETFKPGEKFDKML